MRHRFASAVFVLAAAVAVTIAGTCERVMAFGDLHGAYKPFRSMLLEYGLIDAENRWTGDGTCLVQLGDLVDRGPRSRELLDLTKSLREQAPHEVFTLLGNHEVMNMVGDLRYTDPAEFAAFACEESVEEREAGYVEYLNRFGDENPDEAAARAAFDQQYPPGWFAHRRAFSPEGEYGSWLLKQRVAVKLRRTLFVHGGLSLRDSERGLDALNRQVREEILAYHRLRERLEKVGWLNPLTPFSSSFAEVAERLSRTFIGDDAAGVEPPAADTAREFLALVGAAFVRDDGPVWNRSFAKEDEREFLPTLQAILSNVGAGRVVVGHTTQKTPYVGVRFGERAFFIDTGAGPAYEGRISALELPPSGLVYAVYPGERELVGEPVYSDDEVENFLLNAKIIEAKEIGTGITKPMRMLLELDGQTMAAAWKDVEIDEMGLTRFSGGVEVNFTDKYVYEVAAYRLDRELGMNMVPVAVLREVDGKDGTLIQWIHGSMSETARAEQGLTPPDPGTLSRQKDTMKVFDALIYNSDRNTGNMLVTTRNWKLHPIDHSRAFRMSREPLENWMRQPASLPPWLYTNMKSLTKRRLRDVLKGPLSNAQISAILGRRDKIIEKIDADRAEYGDQMVFQGKKLVVVPMPAD